MTDIDSSWKNCVMSTEGTIGDVISNLTSSTRKIALIVSSEDKLLGTITDGDVRRGLLSGFDIRSNLESVVNKKPIVVSPKVSIDQVKELMLSNRIQQIPILQEDGKLVGVHFWDELEHSPVIENQFIIMAGGAGKRLLPHTANTPKPMVPIHGKPILEHIILKAKRDGFQNFVIAVHHLSEVIENYFSDGKSLGVSISYIRETSPLGTAGSLSYIDPDHSLPFVVTNGDVLTDINYSDLLAYHIHNQAAATLAVREHTWQNPFGVVLLQGKEVTQYEEKPVVTSLINSGVYALNPLVLKLLSKSEFLDMSTLLKKVLASNEKIVAYPLYENWIDVGNPQDLETARVRGLK